jgi:hypothetical protein
MIEEAPGPGELFYKPNILRLLKAIAVLTELAARHPVTQERESTGTNNPLARINTGRQRLTDRSAR